jgi:hypothetical protein
MSPFVRKHGGIIIHIIVATFSFLGLAIVCDDYFVSSLDRICAELKLSPDVAGKFKNHQEYKKTLNNKFGICRVISI